MCCFEILCYLWLAWIVFTAIFVPYQVIRGHISDRMTNDMIQQSANSLNLEDVGWAKGRRIWEEDCDKPSGYIVVERRHELISCYARIRAGFDKSTSRMARYCPRCRIILPGVDKEEDFNFP